MTITPPTPAPIVPVDITGYPRAGFPITTITPLTYRDGLTYLEKMEALRQWIAQTLIPWMEEETTGLSESWTAEVTALVADVNAALTAQADQVNTALTAQDAEVDQKIADLTTYVNTTVQQIIDNSLEANDGVVHDLVLNLSSQTRAALDSVYQHKDSVNDSAVAALFGTDGSATQTAGDGRYVKGTAVQDVSHGGTGVSAVVPNALIVGGGGATDPFVEVDPATAGFFLASGGACAPPSFIKLLDDTANAADKVLSSQKTYQVIDGKTLYGNYSARPAANTVRAGTIYAARDVPELYMSDGTAWFVIGAGGNEIGYAEQIPLFRHLTGVTPSDVPGFTTTFVVGERPIDIRVTCRLANEQAGNSSVASIQLDTAEKARIEKLATSASIWETGNATIRISGLTPGSVHTAKVQVKSQNAGGVTLIAGDATNPNNIQVVTV